MELGPFALISVFYLFLGVRLVFQLVPRFRQTFDRNFTPADRVLVDQAAFFILVPISVALHELGHAVAIWAFGGEVLDWGFYGFAGYVGFDPAQFTQVQQVLIAAAGTIVNVLLAALAIGLVFLKRPPMRAAINELLIQFTWISLLNALLLYPLLDLVSGLNGDWAQMYYGGVPALTLIIVIVQIAILALLFWAWRSPRARARIARLTDDRSWSQQAPRRGPRRGPGEVTSIEAILREAAARVASGWSSPVEAAIQRGTTTTALVLTWGPGSLRRSVLVIAQDSGETELIGVLRAEGFPPQQRALGRAAGPLDGDRLTMILRLAMETVEGWNPLTSEQTPGSTNHIALPAD